MFSENVIRGKFHISQLAKLWVFLVPQVILLFGSFLTNAFACFTVKELLCWLDNTSLKSPMKFLIHLVLLRLHPLNSKRCSDFSCFIFLTDPTRDPPFRYPSHPMPVKAIKTSLFLTVRQSYQAHDKCLVIFV